MTKEKIERALAVLSSPAKFDKSTIEAARQIVRTAMLLGIGRIA